ncbi:MAG: hypothetical protein J0L85_16250, partial [Zoogloea sp.]|nr:hypothetical protein [Zoogloea sp.]
MPEASSSPQCAAFWSHCLNCLEQELPAQQFKTWILPLRAEELPGDEGVGLLVGQPALIDTALAHQLDGVDAAIALAGSRVDR